MKKIFLLLALVAILTSPLVLADSLPPEKKYIPGCAVLQNISAFPDVKFIAAYYTNSEDNPYPTHNIPDKITTLDDTTCTHANLKTHTVQIYALSTENYQKSSQDKSYNPADDINAYPLPPLEVVEGSTLNPEDELVDMTAKDTYFHRVYTINGIDNERRLFFITHLEDKTDITAQKARETVNVPANLDMKLKTDTPVFKDIPANSTYAKAVLDLKRKGVVTGYTDGNYKTDNLINRAEFAKIIMTNYRGTETYDCTLKIFRDVPSDADTWFRDPVCNAYHEGIITGYPDMTFRPGQHINVAEAAKMIIKANKVVPEKETDPWYRAFMSIFEKFNGIPPTISSPAQAITRGEMALLMYAMNEHVLELY